MHRFYENLFLSNPTQNILIAKTEDRKMVLSLFGEELVWIHKSQKREDILADPLKMKTNINNISITFEAWNTIIKQL